MRTHEEILERMKQIMDEKLEAMRTNNRKIIARTTEWERALQWVMSGYSAEKDPLDAQTAELGEIAQVSPSKK